jgi:two-component system NtrC family sensor kinase
MKGVGLFIFFFHLVSCINAQDTLPRTYEIRNDTAFLQELKRENWQILIGVKKEWTINDVRRPPISTGFHLIDTTDPGKYKKEHRYWFRYRLKNSMDRIVKLSLDSYSDRDDFYVIDQQGRSRHFVTGRSVPWKEKDGLKESNFIPVELNPGDEIVVYDRAWNARPGFPDFLKLSFVNTEKAIQRDFLDNQDNLIDEKFKISYFALGFFLLAACFNFLFYWTSREKTYLFLALNLFFLCVEIIIESFSRMLPPIQLYTGTPMMISQFFFLYFVRYYFETFLYKPAWDKFLRVISFLLLCYLVFIIIYPGGQVNSFETMVIRVIALNLVFLATYFIFLHLRRSVARLFAIAMIPFLVFQLILGVFITLQYMNIRLPAFAQWYFRNSSEIGTLFAAWSVLLFTWDLFKRYEQQQKLIAQKELEKEVERTRMIEEQKLELEKRVTERTAELKESLEDLKNTQAQLIQSEKMASLGELTAGIAHEIQNPLNFVNNFSEVNTELIEEIKSQKSKLKSEELDQLLDDVTKNNEKINHHGKRADAIVKGMLQHSRSSSGQKEPTDINALADEYLRLAYHGLRAKDKTFNATMKTDLDQNIGKINIIPQDIGRVILNLVTNAFYVVDEKKKQTGDGYEPTVSVSTMKVNDKVEIRVADNGNGIPTKVLDKIFQPFFTTKPTGQGTGLGLSLSYDIVKAHGGEIKVKTKESEGSIFIIVLPVS